MDIEYVCPHCGHEEIYVTLGTVDAQQVLGWTKDGKEPIEYDYETTLDANLPTYLCPFCLKFFDKPILREKFASCEI